MDWCRANYDVRSNCDESGGGEQYHDNLRFCDFADRANRPPKCRGITHGRPLRIWRSTIPGRVPVNVCQFNGVGICQPVGVSVDVA